MIFLQKDKDSGEYQLAPSFSSFRKIEAANERLYDQRLTELASIIKAGKGQLPALTEWLVRLVEEPETRYDGTADISYSFRGLHSEGADEEEQDEEKAPFVLSDYSSVNLPHIAESLTDSHKQRISAVLERQLQEALSAGDDDEDSSLDYDLVNLVANWDLDQMTMRVNAMIQNSDPSDSKRINILMSFITYAFYDEELSSLSYRYREAADAENTEELDAEDETSDEAEPVVESEMPVETAPVVQPIPEITENAVVTVPVEQMNTDAAVNVAETGSAGPETPVKAENKTVPGPEAIRLKREKLMTALVRKFNDRYQYLLAKGFKTEDEIEPAEPHLDKPIITTN
jgi:hypothetical protein